VDGLEGGYPQPSGGGGEKLGRRKGRSGSEGEEIVGGRGGLGRLRMFRVQNEKQHPFSLWGYLGCRMGFVGFCFLCLRVGFFCFSYAFLGFLEWDFSFPSPYFTMVSTFWWYSTTILVLQ